MIYRDRDGRKVFETFDSIGILLSDRLPHWLRAPDVPAILRPRSFGTQRRDPVTLDLFTGEPKP